MSRATAYRYVDEAVRVLAAQAPTLHEALARVAADGWSYVILDGKLFDTDQLVETTTSAKGETIDAWYSGKHRDFGANIQEVIRPDGLPIWTCDAMPGHLHDVTCAQHLDVTGVLYWAASELDLPTLADSGYEGAGQGIYTRTSSPPTDIASRSTTVPTTPSFDPCVAAENDVSPFSPAAGAPSATALPAPVELAIPSAPCFTSVTSNTATYPRLVEITSLSYRTETRSPTKAHALNSVLHDSVDRYFYPTR